MVNIEFTIFHNSTTFLKKDAGYNAQKYEDIFI